MRLALYNFYFSLHIFTWVIWWYDFFFFYFARGNKLNIYRNASLPINLFIQCGLVTGALLSPWKISIIFKVPNTYLVSVNLSDTRPCWKTELNGGRKVCEIYHYNHQHPACHSKYGCLAAPTPPDFFWQLVMDVDLVCVLTFLY